jgi:hypothetical protein
MIEARSTAGAMFVRPVPAYFSLSPIVPHSRHTALHTTNDDSSLGEPVNVGLQRLCSCAVVCSTSTMSKSGSSKPAERPIKTC